MLTLAILLTALACVTFWRGMRAPDRWAIWLWSATWGLSLMAAAVWVQVWYR